MDTSIRERVAARGEYAGLYHHLSAMKRQRRWSVSFPELETVLGFGLPASARIHRSWWDNQKRSDSHSMAWQAAGWKVREVDLDAETIVFERYEGAFWFDRTCLRDPVPEIFEAAMLLDRAISHHLRGDRDEAADLISRTDSERVRAFTESLWGKRSENPDYLRLRHVPGLPDTVAETERDPKEKPNAKDEKDIVARWGRHCVYCGVPLIHNSVPKALRLCYPDLRIWGTNNRNDNQHAAFQLMWMQFDHVVPRSRGGRTDIENVVVSCAPCNYGKGNYMLEELGLLDPRLRPVVRTSSWDGLERLLKKNGGDARSGRK